MKNKKIILKLIQKMSLQSFNKEGNLDNLKVRNFIKHLSKLPRPLAIFGLTNYLKQLRELVRAHTLIVESDIKLDKSQIVRIKKMFDKTDLITDIKSEINSQLLGGIRVSLGDTLYDFSISSKLNQLKEVING